MHRLRFITLALAAAFAISAVGAASASAALPEFGAPFPNKFTGTTGKGTLETTGGSTISCTGGSNKGEVTGAKTVAKIEITFTGCELIAFAAKCKTAGKAEGEVETKVLKAALGYVAKPKAGLDIEPEVGTEFAKLECAVFGGVPVTVKGDVVCAITPNNTLTTKYELICEQAKGKQKYTKLEGGATSVLKTKIGFGGEEESGITSTTNTTLTTAAELKA